jgi:hypothetical protein
MGLRPSDTGRVVQPSKSFTDFHLRSPLNGHERCFSPGARSISPSEEMSVSTLPLGAHSEPLGIVIKSGAPKPKPVRFWAYLWAADDENALQQHWHERVPSEHAA